MLRQLKRRSLLVRVIIWMLVVALSGADVIVQAASCDTDNFEGFFLAPGGKTTMAITKTAYSWSGASAAAKSSGGRLAVIADSTQNAAIFTNLSSHFTVTSRPTTTPQKKAWIDLIDPLNSPAWSIEGSAPVVLPGRFSWADDFSGYSNWAVGQPDGYCTNAEQLAHPDHNCYGENWATINADGSWSDEGNHEAGDVTLKGIVEWPQQILDCVAPVSAPITAAPEVLPGQDTGAQYCADSAKISAAECQNTTDGSKLCPFDKIACNATQDPPICPAGSTLNTERDMCQAAPVVTCGAGYSWDSSIDRCVAAATCSDGGVLNPLTDKCEKLALTTCPATYTFDANPASPTFEKCVKPVQCSEGVFNPATDRCEASATPGCPDPAYSLNGSTGLCEMAPVCPAGTAYSSAYNVCTQSPSTCPAGYVLNFSMARCQKAPECSQGIFSIWTNKCESTSTYAASVQYTCPSGGTLSGTTCTSTSSYSASLVGAANFTKPVYMLNGNMYETSAGDEGGTPALYGYISTSTFSGSLNVYSDGRNLDVSGWGGLVGYVSNTPFSSSKGVYVNGGNLYGIGYEGLALYGYLATTAGTYGGTYTCPSGGSLSGTSCVVQSTYAATASYTCPSGGTLSGTTCTVTTQTNPTCTSGTMDYANHVCYAPYEPTCSQGTYDNASGLCVSSATCTGGVLNGTSDKCEASPSLSCGALTLDATAGICYSNPVCSLGAYDPALKTCVGAIAKDCGTYTAADATTCQAAPTCASDPTFSQDGTVAYAPSVDKCVSLAQHDCGTGTTYIGLPVEQCEAVPVCANGVYSPSTDACFNSTQTCPAGNYTCHQIAGDTTEAAPGVPMQYCSPNNCQSDTSGWITDTDTESGLNDKKNDGAHGANGECLGNIYLYNGNDMRCRLKDYRGAVGSWVKLGGSIALACTGVGTALATQLLGAQAVLNGTMAAQLVATLANAAAQIAMNVSVDAAMGTLETSGLLVSSATTVVAAGMSTYFTPAPGGVLGGGNFLVTDQGTLVQSFANDMGESLGQQITYGVSEAIAQPVNTMSSAVSNMMNTGAFQDYMTGIKTIADQMAPAINQSLLGSYQTTRCCHPDKLSGTCKSEEFSEANLAANGACHIVGNYCASRTLSVCMVTKQTSCCFSTKLARIFHEQGRPQLQMFGEDGGWGTPRSPNCRGFTPQEFQSLNFGAMDLSEYTNDLEQKMNNIQPMVDQYIKSVGEERGAELDSQYPTGVPEP